MVAKEPFKVLYTGLKKKIGDPKDYNNYSKRDVDTTIPVEETDQNKSINDDELDSLLKDLDSDILDQLSLEETPP